MKKPWVDTDPEVIAVKHIARKTAKVLVIAAAVYVMSYGAGRAVGEHAVNQANK